MTSSNIFDVIIAGAGSIGVPSAYYLAKAGFKVLVIDPLPSNGQGSNKHAIGGVRATHTNLAKINISRKSIDILSNWQEEYGENIEWRSGGYSFVAYDEPTKKTLQEIVAFQQGLNLNIRWLERDEMLSIAPDLNPSGLLGGTNAPEDGYASPLKVSYAFYRKALEAGAKFHFNERVIAVKQSVGRVEGVQTDKGSYACKYVIDAAGSWSSEISKCVGIDLQVRPETHQAGITEAVAPMLETMIIDLRPRPGSSNFYFYQHPTGKVIFCVTPEPSIIAFDEDDTSDFLPHAAQRLIETMPRLANIRIRRTWRGTYPMTPDGNPIFGEFPGLDGFIHATGTCGQGFMLGPGMGWYLKSLLTKTLSENEKDCLYSLRLDRDYSMPEKLM